MQTNNTNNKLVHCSFEYIYLIIICARDFLYFLASAAMTGSSKTTGSSGLFQARSGEPSGL